MVNVYSAEKINSQITANYGNPMKSQGVALHRFPEPENVSSPSSQEGFSNQFAHAVYGDGPYSLTCPNRTTDILGQNCDYLA